MPVELNELARKMVGDGQKPNMFFISMGDDVKMVTSLPYEAYEYWQRLASQRSAYVQSALEDRLTGTICSVHPVDGEGSSLVMSDEWSKRVN